jgi:hypothetical protein
MDNSSISLSSAVSVQAFGIETCYLLVSVASCVQHVLPDKKELFPPNLAAEWNEFFSEGIYAFIFPLFVRLVGKKMKQKNKNKETNKNVFWDFYTPYPTQL